MGSRLSSVNSGLKIVSIGKGNTFTVCLEISYRFLLGPVW